MYMCEIQFIQIFFANQTTPPLEKIRLSPACPSTRRYDILRGPTSSSCGGLLCLFLHFGQLKSFFVVAVFAHLRPFLVFCCILLTFHSNLDNIDKKSKK